MKWAAIVVTLLILYFFTRSRIRNMQRKKAVKRIEQEFQRSIDPAVISAVDSNDYAQLENLLASKDRAELEKTRVWFLARNDCLEKARQWVETHEDSVTALAFCGMALVNKAWERRTGAVASKVSTDGAMDFAMLLNEARLKLQQAITLDPTSPLAYASMMSTGMGIQNKELLWDTYAKLREHQPNLTQAHLSMALTMTPKWGGSKSELLNLCRDLNKIDNSGCLSGLIPFAHFELVQDLASDRKVKEYMSYFDDKEIKEEIIAAYEKTIDKSPSIDLDASLNQFANIFNEMNDKKRMREVFNRLENRYTRNPWHYQQKLKPVEAFLMTKQKAGIKLA